MSVVRMVTPESKDGWGAVGKVGKVGKVCKVGQGHGSRHAWAG